MMAVQKDLENRATKKNKKIYFSRKLTESARDVAAKTLLSIKKL
jgi:hypothetical protein